MAYHRNRPRNPWGRKAGLEMMATAVVIVLLVGVIVLFLFVYHDFPLRTS
jgi:succinate dehydrogenase hydrophobic anchor subunit